MPRDITITFADGTQHTYKGAPDDITPEAVQARAQQQFGKPVKALDGGRGAPAAPKDEPQRSGLQRFVQMLSPAGQATALFDKQGRQDLVDAAAGTARGVKDVIDTGAQWLAGGFDKLTGTQEGQRVAAMNDAGKQEFDAGYGDSTAARAARVGGNVLATLPVGGVLGAGAKAAGMTRLGGALASGGMTTGAPVAANATLAAKAADMGIRMAGGAGTGAVSAGLVDQESAVPGAVVGALLPPVAKVAGAAGNAVAAAVRPFTKGGQERIAGDVLRSVSTNQNALSNLRATGEMIPGSAPTAMMSAGDEGLSGLSRTLQSTDPRYAAELSTRTAAQNAARTAALEEVAGNTGKLSLAREARDVATGPMREGVLDAAGRLPAKSVLDAIDDLLAKPDNAGRLVQQALREQQSRIGKNIVNGEIDARALYAIRKDINDVIGGRLQGEAGNMKLASSQLIDVKKAIDRAIDQASRRVDLSAGRSVAVAGPNTAGAAGPRPTWQGYLDEYTQRSIPINQMEKLDEVMRSISTGTVDKSGNAILSAAKLNNLLRNQAQDLQKVLAPEQLDLLRRMAADLNASQLATNAGKAVGSNTVQNIAGANALSALVGKNLGQSSAAQATIGRGVNWLYKVPDEQIRERLGAALLDPQEAARLMADPQMNALLRGLTSGAGQIGYRAAPALAAQ